MRTFRVGLLFGAAMFILGGTASAEPTTVSASAGPVPVSGVPVEVCVNDDCQTTPELSAVALDVEVTADATEAVPTNHPRPVQLRHGRGVGRGVRV
jgi:hypothetical protein